MATNTSSTCEPNCFIPSIARINVGDSVTFKNSKSSPTVIASGSPYDGPDGYFNSGPIGSGLKYTTTFNTENTYKYFDLISPWMQGTIIVGNPPPNSPPTADAGISKPGSDPTVALSPLLPDESGLNEGKLSTIDEGSQEIEYENIDDLSFQQIDEVVRDLKEGRQKILDKIQFLERKAADFYDNAKELRSFIEGKE